MKLPNIQSYMVYIIVIRFWPNRYVLLPSAPKMWCGHLTLLHEWPKSIPGTFAAYKNNSCLFLVLARTIYIYGACTISLAEISQNTRSYMAGIHSSGQPYSFPSHIFFNNQSRAPTHSITHVLAGQRRDRLLHAIPACAAHPACGAHFQTGAPG